MKTQFLKTATTFLVATSSAFGSTSAVKILQQTLGSKTMVCEAFQEGPSQLYRFSVSRGQIQIKARDFHDGVYQIDRASVTASQLKLTLSNETDGPHSQDLLVIPLKDLQSLGEGNLRTVRGLDIYSEDFDGTVSKYHMNCEIEVGL